MTYITTKEKLFDDLYLYNIGKDKSESLFQMASGVLDNYFKEALSSDGGKTYHSENRKCKDLQIDPNTKSEKLSLIIKYLNDPTYEAIKDIYGDILVIPESGWSILKYEEGDKFDWHQDASPNNPRDISVIICFNEEYDGGVIDFQKFQVSKKMLSGDLMVFPSTAKYSHRVTKIKSGTRYVAVNWFRIEK
jgi:hypothetical protein